MKRYFIAHVFETLDTGFNTTSKGLFQDMLPGLNNQFMFNSTNYAPVIFTEGNKLFISKANKRAKEFQAYSQNGHPLSEIGLTGDSVKYMGEAFTFPAQLSRYADAYSLYCRNQNELALIYPCLDSIYTYNITTRKEEKHVISNKDFKPLNSFDFGKRWDAKYNNEYRIYNFFYRGIAYNPVSKHYLLFYKKAAEHKANSDSLPTLEDEPIQVLVLDDHFKTLEYMTLGKDYCVMTGFLIVPGKGIAIPKYSNSLEDDKKIVFDIFNL